MMKNSKELISTHGHRSGIYRLVNTETGRAYIGQTIRFKQRISFHLSKLKVNKHPCRYLQRSWNTHGADSFELQIALICEMEHLTFYEQLVIDHAKGNTYNTAKAAGSAMNDPKVRAKHKKAMKKAMKKRQITVPYRGMQLTIQTGLHPTYRWKILKIEDSISGFAKKR